MTMLEIKGTDRRIECISGKSFRIMAEVEGASKKEEKTLIWQVISGPAVSKGNGLFQVEKVDQDTDVKISAICQADKRVSKDFLVTIVSPKLEIFPNTDIKCRSGEEIQLETRCGGLVTNNRWEIFDESQNTGSINSFGLYSAPKIVSLEKTIKIMVTDQNSVRKDEIEIRLVPVEVHFGEQPSLRARESAKQLNICVRNDKNGNDNFSCRLITQNGGSVSEKGVYTPPSFAVAETTVEIEVTSKLNKNCKKILQLKVLPAKCKKCNHIGLGEDDNFCPSCGEPQGFPNILRQILKNNRRNK